MNDCIFCKIVDGTIPSPRVLEDDQFICIRDLHPQAATHLLVIPKEHVASLAAAFPAAGAQRPELVGSLFEFAARVARKNGLLPEGFRAVINTGARGGQSVFHLHAHLLGGDDLGNRFG